jgi:hypothetical protein
MAIIGTDFYLNIINLVMKKKRDQARRGKTTISSDVLSSVNMVYGILMNFSKMIQKIS